MRLRATTKIRNDVMIAAREQEGLNQTEFGNRCGISVSHVSALEKLDFTSPNALLWAQKVADYLCVDVQAICPGGIRGLRVPTTLSAVRDVPVDNLLPVPAKQRALPLSPAKIIEDADLVEAVRSLVGGLPKRRRVALKMRLFRGIAWSGIGKRLHVTRERARQIGTAAARKLDFLLRQRFGYVNAGWFERLNRE